MCLIRLPFFLPSYIKKTRLVYVKSMLVISLKHGRRKKLITTCIISIIEKKSLIIFHSYILSPEAAVSSFKEVMSVVDISSTVNT